MQVFASDLFSRRQTLDRDPQAGTFCDHFGGPGRDHGRVGTCLQRFAIARDFVFANLQLLGQGLLLVGKCGIASGSVEGLDSSFPLAWSEEILKPEVDPVDDLVLTDVGRLRMAGLGQLDIGQLKPAAVVRTVVVPGTLHMPTAARALYDAAKEVRAGCATRRPRQAATGVLLTADLHRFRGLIEGFLRNDRFVDRGGGEDPGLARVPAHLGAVAEGDVLDVDEDLFLALLVPDFVPGVARVPQDGGDSATYPGRAGTMGVPSGVMRRRAGDALSGEAVGNGYRSPAGEVLGEDAAHHDCGDRIDL